MKTHAKNLVSPALVLAALALNYCLIPASQAAGWAFAGPLNTIRSDHTATLLTDGRVLVAGGYNSTSGFMAQAELYEPATGQWTAVSPLGNARADHTATLLPNGKVLVVGGYNASGPLAGVELYDPVGGTWTQVNPLSAARFMHTATLLRDGRVLVAGGFNSSDAVVSAELYDPVAGTWTSVNALNTARFLHTATLLPDGKVLVAGGTSASGALAGAELYDADAGTWTPVNTLNSARFMHTATLLPDGKVLVAGGYSASGALAGAELYDPAARSWTPVNALSNARSLHAATLLPNGKVLVAGGEDDSGTALSSVELYDPGTGSWTAASTLNSAREWHTATLLANGQVLVAGGYNGNYLSSAELYDTASGTGTVTGVLSSTRQNHAVTLLMSGKVLIAGGMTTGGGFLSSAEVYDPAAETWSVTGALNTARGWPTATLLPDGKVLVAGGFNSTNGYLASAELYDPATGAWTTTGEMHAARSDHTATLLSNGRVLVAGGGPGAELYDPATGTWTTTGALNTSRGGHTATLLPNGRVLVAGGGGYLLSSAELYDPAAGTWATTGEMATARGAHTATLLPNGKVLVAAGYNTTSGYLTNAEVYDSATGTWTATGALAKARWSHTATLLPNGKVLVAGGAGGGTGPEMYDPATGTWTTSGAINTERRYHTATLLLSGKVLLVGGGNDASGPLSSAELYDVGLGFSAPWQPQIATVTSPLNLGGSLTVTGSGFRGVSGGSSGSTQDSPADHPVVQLRSLESGQTLSLLATNWSANSFSSVPVSGFPPGWALATVFVNGIPSTGQVVNLSVPMAPVITAQPASSTNLIGTAASFTVAATGSAPLSYRWIKDGTNHLVDGGGVSGATTATLSLTDVESSDAGLYRVVVSNAAGSTNSADALLTIWSPCITVSADRSTNAMGGALVLHVRTFDCGTSNTIPNLAVVVYVKTAGTTRTLPVTTGTNGEATVYFQPLAGETGQYQVSAGLPGQPMPPPGDDFAIVGIGFGTNEVAHRLIVGVPLTNCVELRNLTGVPLSGLAATLVDAPANVTFTNVTFQGSPPGTLAGNGTNTLSYVLKATGPSPASASCRLRVTSAEGATNDLPLTIEIAPPVPQLAAAPASLRAAMLRGGQTLVEVQLSNTGGAPAHDVQVLIPSEPWLSLVSAGRIASLGAGETRAVMLALRPGDDVPLTSYSSYILFHAVETDLTLPCEFMCVSTNVGSLQVVAVDEYTYYAEGAPRVAHATVQVSDHWTGASVASGVTDASGAVLFPDLAEAYYDIEVGGDNHGGFSTTYLVAAGRTNEVVAFLSRETVSYTWVVLPTEDPDHYDIQLLAGFETAVPLPYLSVVPAELNLCNYGAGSTQVNLTITNHGLAEARDVQLLFPPHPAWEVRPLAQAVGHLAAHSTVEVPVSIRQIAPNENVPSTMDGQLLCHFTGNNGSFPFSAPIPVRNADVWDCVPPPFVSLEADRTNLCEFTAETNWVNLTISNRSAMVVQGLNLALDAHVHWQIEPLVTNLGSLAPHAQVVVPVRFRKVSSPTSGPSQIEARLAYWAALGSATRWFSRSATLENANPWDCVPSPLVIIQPDRTNLCNFTTETNWVSFTITNQSLIPAEGVALVLGPHLRWQIEPSVSNLGNLPGQSSVVIPVRFRRLPSAVDGPAAIPASLAYHATVEGETRSFSPVIALNNANPWDCVPNPPVIIEPDEIDLCSLRSVTNEVNFTIHNRSDLLAEGARLIFTNDHPHWRMEPPVMELGPLLPQTNFVVTVLFIQQATTEPGPSRFYGHLDYQATVETQTREFSLPIQCYRANDSDCVTGSGGGEWYPPPGGGTNNYDYLIIRGTLQFRQRITVVRNTFTATLEMVNHSTTSPLTNVAVTLDLRDETQHAAADRFGVSRRELMGLTEVDGTGELGCESAGRVVWKLVPATNAAPTAATAYTVGGTISFVQDGQPISIRLYPVPITVQPDPRLVLDYFWERIAYSDNPFTPLTEAALPFAVGMIMRNEGYGTARSIQMEAAEPEIRNNTNGLLMNFNLVGAETNSQPVPPDLNLNLGNLGPSNTVEAIWWLTSSLQANFIDYRATFRHLDDWGETNLALILGPTNLALSLIQRVGIHPLVHVVRADVPTDDGLPDFLVGEGYPTNTLADSLHLSDGAIRPVISMTNAVLVGPPQRDYTNILLTLPESPLTNWVYVRIPDPAPGLPLSYVRRSDGKSLFPGSNVWTTPGVTFPFNIPPYFHLLDYDSTGSYTLGYNADLYLTQQPEDVNAFLGASATFCVIAGGTEPFTYQWFKDGTALAGATNACLTITGIQVADAGGYRVRVSNAVRSLDSATASLRVRPFIAGQPQNCTNVVGGTATFSVSVSGTAPFLYQWSKDGANLSGETAATLAIPNVQLSDDGTTYSVSITSVAGSTLSVGARLRVFPPPCLIPPTNRTVVVGSLLVFTNQGCDPNACLTWSTDPGNPVGSSVVSNGVVRWTPTCAQGSSNYVITLWAALCEWPPARSSVNFTAAVPECVEASLGQTVMLAGTTSSVPVNLVSSTALTNMAFTVHFSSGNFTNFDLTVNSAAVLTQQVDLLQPDQVRLSFTLPAASVLYGPTNVAQFWFTALSNQSSAFVTLGISNIVALKPDGDTAENASGLPGRVVLIGREPLLEARNGLIGEPTLTLYGKPGSSYALEWRTNVLAGAWQFGWHTPMTGLSREFGIEAAKPSQFYRAYEFFADPPILELNSRSGSNVLLLVYKQPTTQYWLESATSVRAGSNWLTVECLSLTNSFQFLQVTNRGEPARLFRVLRP